MNKNDIQTFKKLFSMYCKEEIAAGRCESDSCEFCPINAAYEKVFPKKPEMEDLWDAIENEIAKLFCVMDGDHDTLIFRDKNADIDYQLKLTSDFSGQPDAKSDDQVPKAAIIWYLVERGLANQKGEISSLNGDQMIFYFSSEESSHELRLSQLG